MIQEIKKGVNLKLYYVKGTDQNGKDIVKSQKFKDIKISADPATINAFGEEIGRLIASPLLKIEIETDIALEEASN